MKERAAIYTRVRAPDEDASAQVCYLRQLARQRGFEVVAEYKDIASGAKARRPGLDALMADAKQGRFSVILTNSLACLSKGIKHLLQLTENFKTLHIDLISAQEAIDTSTSTGKLFFDAMASLNQCEGELVKEHIRVGLRRRKLDGFRLGRARLAVSHEAIARDRLSGMSLTQCSKKYKVSRASVVRFVRKAQRQFAGLGQCPPIVAKVAAEFSHEERSMKTPAVQFKFRRPSGAPTHAPSAAMQDALRRLSQVEEMQPLLKKAQTAGRDVVIEVFHSKDGQPLLIHTAAVAKRRA